MRTSLALVLAAVAGAALLLGSAAARADDVEALIRKNLDPRTFDVDSVAQTFVGTAIQDGQTMQLDHDRAVALIREAKQKVERFTLQSFKLLAKTEDGPFISAVYESVIEVVLDRQPVTQKAITHDIYERRDGELKLIYSAEEDTTLGSL